MNSELEAARATVKEAEAAFVNARDTVPPMVASEMAGYMALIAGKQANYIVLLESRVDALTTLLERQFTPKQIEDMLQADANGREWK